MSNANRGDIARESKYLGESGDTVAREQVRVAQQQCWKGHASDGSETERDKEPRTSKKGNRRKTRADYMANELVAEAEESPSSSFRASSSSTLNALTSSSSLTAAAADPGKGEPAS